MTSAEDLGINVIFVFDVSEFTSDANWWRGGVGCRGHVIIVEFNRWR